MRPLKNNKNKRLLFALDLSKLWACGSCGSQKMDAKEPSGLVDFSLAIVSSTPQKNLSKHYTKSEDPFPLKLLIQLLEGSGFKTLPALG